MPSSSAVPNANSLPGVILISPILSLLMQGKRNWMRLDG